MTTHKFGIRLFYTTPPSKPVKDFIPAFHSAIQRQALPGHLLIDVHDYSHVPNGPGILLVAHEAHINVDATGLGYTRKQPSTPAETLAAARAAAKLLTGVTFDSTKFEVFCNDRLAAPTAEEITTAIGGQVTKKAGDPRERLTYVVAG